MLYDRDSPVKELEYRDLPARGGEMLYDRASPVPQRDTSSSHGEMHDIESPEQGKRIYDGESPLGTARDSVSHEGKMVDVNREVCDVEEVGDVNREELIPREANARDVSPTPRPIDNPELVFVFFFL